MIYVQSIPHVAMTPASLIPPSSSLCIHKAWAIKSLEPTIMDPIGAANPLERQVVAESAYFNNSDGGSFRLQQYSW